MRVFLITVIFFIVAPAHALVKPIGFTNTVKSVAVGATSTVKFASTSTGTIYTKIVNIGAASLGAVYRKRAFSPWGALLTAAIVAAGYLIDDATQDITATSPEYTGIGTCLNATPVPASTASECLQRSVTQFGTPHYMVRDPAKNYRYFIKQTSDDVLHSWWDTPGQIDILNDQPAGGVTTVTDTELATALQPALTSQVLQDVLVDPATGVPDSLITEIQDAATQLQTEDDTLLDTDPLTNPSTPNKTVAESQLEELIKANQQPTGSQQEPQPIDYTFNASPPTYDETLVTPDKTDLTVILNTAKTQIDGFTSKVGINATAGDCNISTPFTLGSETGVASIDFCSQAALVQQIGVVVLAIAYLLSGLIVLGVKA
jgi:hypothetical protein